jgi:DNA invertase Pin-like site-specific DNA recombinase
MALVGYVRVSTAAQDGALQRDALVKAGCGKLFEDKASGAKSDRPGLNDALAYIRAGDVLVVWKLDRLGRSLSHLIDTVTALGGRGVGFKSLTEGVDTSTSNGRLVFHIFGSLAEFERDLIRERTGAGLAAAVARGRRGGRKPVVTPEKLARAQALIAEGLNVREAAARVKVGKTALYEALVDKPVQAAWAVGISIILGGRTFRRRCRRWRFSVFSRRPRKRSRSFCNAARRPTVLPSRCRSAS